MARLRSASIDFRARSRAGSEGEGLGVNASKKGYPLRESSMFRIQDRGRMRSPAADELRDRSSWQEISREAALRAVGVEPIVVVYRNGSADCIEWLDRGHPFSLGVGPHWLGGVRYYRGREQPVRPPEYGGAPAAAPEVPRPPARVVRQPAAPEVRNKTWIEIELLDENGAPVPNEPYSVQLPDGSTRSGTLDAAGRARVDGIDPGSCEISFPEIDTRAWRAA